MEEGRGGRMPPPPMPIGEEAHAKGGCVHLRIHRVHCHSALFFLAPSGQPDAGPTMQPAAPPGGALWGCLPGHLPGHFNLTVHSNARGLWHLNCMFACHASFFPSQGARCGHFDVTSNFHLPWRSSACHPLPVSVPCMSLMPLLQGPGQACTD